MDLTLYVGIPQGSKPQTCALKSANVLSTSRSFQAPILSTGQVERFEWKGSSGSQVASLGGRGHGKKCVRLSTGEVVAVFTQPGMSLDKMGKMAFLGDRAMLGGGFEVLAVLGCVSMIEKARRVRKQRTRNNGVTGVNGVNGVF